MSNNNPTSETLTCPRCLGPIEAYPDLKLAARSRATKDRDIEICPPCGSDEAMRQFHTGVMIPVSEWPVKDPHEYHQPIQDTIDTNSDQVAQVTDWLKNKYLPLRERETRPITGLLDSRAWKLLDDPTHKGVYSGLGYNHAYLYDLISENPREAAEIYFLRYVEKPEPPLPMPSWAEHKETYWGEFPEIAVLFKSSIGKAGSWSVCFKQIKSIQFLDDVTHEPMDEVIIHEGPVEFEITDGRNGLLMPGDISVVEMLAASIEDVARRFWEATPRELKRSTDPGEPELAGRGGGL